MDLYFGKIKSKKMVPYQYRYSNYREYLESHHNHIKYLESMIDILIQDIVLLDNRLNAIRPNKNKIENS